MATAGSPPRHLRRHVIVKQSNIFKDTLSEQGKQIPADFPVLRNIVVAKDRETALREVGPAIAASYNVFTNWGLVLRRGQGTRTANRVR